MKTLFWGISFALFCSQSLAQEDLFAQACKDHPDICNAEIIPDGPADQAKGFQFADKNRRGAPVRPVMAGVPLENPDIQITISEQYLAQAIRSLLTERLVLAEPAATNFLKCADKERIRFDLGSPSEPNEFGPLEIILQDNNCTFGFGNACHNCGIKHFFFYLYPVYRQTTPGSGTIDFYLWPGWLLMTSPPGGRELPFWISMIVMDGMWKRFFVPNWDGPSGYRKPLFSLDLDDTLVLEQDVEILGQPRKISLKPTETALLFYRAEPYRGKNGRIVFQARF